MKDYNIRKIRWEVKEGFQSGKLDIADKNNLCHIEKALFQTERNRQKYQEDEADQSMPVS